MNWRTQAGVFAGLLLLAFIVRVIRYERLGEICFGPHADEIETSRIAQSIAWHGVFADPFPTPTGPTAHHAPVYPFLLSLIYDLPPSLRTGARAGLNIVLASVTCAAVYLTGIALGLPPLTGLIAASLLALVPVRMVLELCGDQEQNLVAALTVATIGYTAACFRQPQKGFFWLGVLWGAVLLTAPVMVFVFLVVCLLALIQGGLRKEGTVMLMAAGAVLIPWTIRNHQVLGGWFFVRDTLGLELRVSNADDAFADPDINSERGAMQTYHPFFNRAVSDQVRREGEPQLYARYGREAVQWMVSHPDGFERLTFEHFRNFWLPLGSSPRQMLWRVVSWVLAAAGLVFLWTKDLTAAILLLALLVAYPLPYYFTQSYSRYAYPVEWALTLVAVYGLQRIVVYARFPALLATIQKQR